MKNGDNLQYVTATDYSGENRYILGRIDQQTLSLTLRMDLNITPQFSVRYYGSPFVSKGKYSEFKRVTDPESAVYSGRFTLLDNMQTSGGRYQFDEDNDHICGLHDR